MRLIRSVLEHNLFITAAYVELNDVLSTHKVSDKRLSRMAKTIMKLMLAVASAQKDTLDMLFRLLVNNILPKRDALLHDSLLGSYFDKLLCTSPIFIQNLFDGFIKTLQKSRIKQINSLC